MTGSEMSGEGVQGEELHVVFGAAGSAGGAVLAALAAEGTPVRAVTRGGLGHAPAGVEDVRADARNLDAVREACRGATHVHHCINVPYADWHDLLPGIMDHLVEGTARAGAVLIYCDNLYMYGPSTEPLAEDTPRRPVGAKGRLRVRLEERLLEAHAAGRVRATIGRGSDFYGPGGTNTIAGMLVLPAIREGKKARWVGDLDQPHTMSYLEDFARGLIRLGRDEKAQGEVWHVPAGPPVTGQEFIERAFRVAGREPRLGVYRRWQLRLAGLFDRQLRELLEVLYQFERPFVMDTSKFEEAFGPWEVTLLDEGLARSLAGSAHPARDPGPRR